MSETPRIMNRCPSCHGSTLIIGSNGGLVCGLIGCKDPLAVGRLLPIELPYPHSPDAGAPKAAPAVPAETAPPATAVEALNELALEAQELGIYEPVPPVPPVRETPPAAPDLRAQVEALPRRVLMSDDAKEWQVWVRRDAVLALLAKEK